MIILSYELTYYYFNNETNNLVIDCDASQFSYQLVPQYLYVLYFYRKAKFKSHTFQSVKG